MDLREKSKNKLYSLGVFALGFFLPLNVYLIPWTARTPRAVDVLGLILAAVLIVSLLQHRRMKRQSVLKVYTLLLLLVPLLWHSLMSSVSGTAVYATRWLIAVIWGIVIWNLSQNNHSRVTFFNGMLAGCTACLGVTILQFAGLFEFTQSVGLAPQDSVDDVSFHSIWRVPGLEKNVNGSAAVISLALPAAIGLVEEKRISRKWVFIILGVVVLGSAITLNRSSFLVSSTTLVAWLFLSKSEWISGYTKFAVVALVLVGIVIYGPPGGWERWGDLENLSRSDNVQVRVETTISSAILAAENPLGMGIDYKAELAERTMSVNGTTHNAFTQIALRGGWPIALFVLFKLGFGALLLLRRSNIEGWISLHLLGLFLFEEYLSNMTIMIVVAWLMLRSSDK